MKHVSFYPLFCCLSALFIGTNSMAAIQSDINQDDRISLGDIILGLQVLTGITPAIPEYIEGIDVDGDGRLGQPEMLNGLKLISEYGEFGVVISTGRIWMDRNLGASRVAESSIDTEAYGDLYQWGRGADGHEKRDSGMIVVLSSTNEPGHDDFIVTITEPYDWITPQNDNLWQGVSGINNPCPAGFRLPTNTELEAERSSWSTDNAAGAYASPLKLVLAGYRSRWEGAINGAGFDAIYWSGTVDGTDSRLLSFGSSPPQHGQRQSCFRL